MGITVSHTPSSKQRRGEGKWAGSISPDWHYGKTSFTWKELKVMFSFWGLGFGHLENLSIAGSLLSTVPLTCVNILFLPWPQGTWSPVSLSSAQTCLPLSRQTCEQLPKTSLHLPGTWPTSCVRDSSASGSILYSGVYGISLLLWTHFSI